MSAVVRGNTSRVVEAQVSSSHHSHENIFVEYYSDHHLPAGDGQMLVDNLKKIIHYINTTEIPGALPFARKNDNFTREKTIVAMVK